MMGDHGTIRRPVDPQPVAPRRPEEKRQQCSIGQRGIGERQREGWGCSLAGAPCLGGAVFLVILVKLPACTQLVFRVDVDGKATLLAHQ
jgi:hypothetical protein